MSNNCLTTLTPGFVQLQNLQVLNVANNELTKINEIYYLSKLRDFDAFGNNLSLDSIQYLSGCSELANLRLRKSGQEKRSNPCILEQHYESFIRKYLCVSESLDGAKFRCVAEVSWNPPAEEQAKVAEFVKLFGDQPQKVKSMSSRPV